MGHERQFMIHVQLVSRSRNYLEAFAEARVTLKQMTGENLEKTGELRSAILRTHFGRLHLARMLMNIYIYALCQLYSTVLTFFKLVVRGAL